MPFTVTTEVLETSNTISEATLTVQDDREYDLSAETLVHAVTESGETTSVVTEAVEAFTTSQSSFMSTSEVYSPTSLGNIVFNTFPDSSENTIPYSSSSRVMDEFSSTTEDLNSKTDESSSTFEISTKQTLQIMTTEVPASTLAITEENLEQNKSFSILTSNAEETTTKEDFHVELIVTNTTEEPPSNSLGSDLVVETSTAPAISPSTNNIPTTDFNYHWSEINDSNAEISSTVSRDLNDMSEYFVFGVTTEPSCLNCPESVCPVCLVQACSVTEAASPPGKTTL